MSLEYKTIEKSRQTSNAIRTNSENHFDNDISLMFNKEPKSIPDVALFHRLEKTRKNKNRTELDLICQEIPEPDRIHEEVLGLFFATRFELHDLSETSRFFESIIQNNKISIELKKRITRFFLIGLLNQGLDDKFVHDYQSLAKSKNLLDSQYYETIIFHDVEEGFMAEASKLLDELYEEKFDFSEKFYKDLIEKIRSTHPVDFTFQEKIETILKIKWASKKENFLKLIENRKKFVHNKRSSIISDAFEKQDFIFIELVIELVIEQLKNEKTRGEQKNNRLEVFNLILEKNTHFNNVLPWGLIKDNIRKLMDFIEILDHFPVSFLYRACQAAASYQDFDFLKDVIQNSFLKIEKKEQEIVFFIKELWPILSETDEVTQKEILNQIIKIKTFLNEDFLKKTMEIVKQNKKCDDFLMHHNLLRQYLSMDIEPDILFFNFLEKTIFIGELSPEYSKETKNLIQIKEGLIKNNQLDSNIESSNEEHDKKTSSSDFKNNAFKDIIFHAIKAGDFDFIDRLFLNFIHSKGEQEPAALNIFTIFLKYLEQCNLNGEEKQKIWVIVKEHVEKLLDDNVIFEIKVWRKILFLFSEHDGNLNFLKRIIKIFDTQKTKKNDEIIIELLMKLKPEEKREILKDIIFFKKNPTPDLLYGMINIAIQDREYHDYDAYQKLSLDVISREINPKKNPLILKLLEKTISLEEASQNLDQVQELYEKFLKSSIYNENLELRFKEILSLSERPSSVNLQESKEEKTPFTSSHLALSEAPEEISHHRMMILEAFEKEDSDYIQSTTKGLFSDLMNPKTGIAQKEKKFKILNIIFEKNNTINRPLLAWDFIKENVKRLMGLLPNADEFPLSFLRKISKASCANEDLAFLKLFFEFSLLHFKKNSKNFNLFIPEILPFLEKQNHQTQKYFLTKIIEMNALDDRDILKKIMLMISENIEYVDLIDHYNLIREYFSMDIDCDDCFLDLLEKAISIEQKTNERPSETKNLSEIKEKIKQKKSFDLIIKEAVKDGHFDFFDQVFWTLIHSKEEKLPPKLNTFCIILNALFLEGADLNHQKKTKTWEIIKNHVRELMRSNILFTSYFCNKFISIAYQHKEFIFLKEFIMFIFDQEPTVKNIGAHVETLFCKLTKEEKIKILDKFETSNKINPRGSLLVEMMKTAIDDQYKSFHVCYKLSLLGISDSKIKYNVKYEFILKFLKKTIALEEASSHPDKLHELYEKFLKSGMSDDDLKTNFENKIKHASHFPSCEKQTSIDCKEEESFSKFIEEIEVKFSPNKLAAISRAFEDRDLIFIESLIDKPNNIETIQEKNNNSIMILNFILKENAKHGGVLPWNFIKGNIKKLLELMKSLNYFRLYLFNTMAESAIANGDLCFLKELIQYALLKTEENRQQVTAFLDRYLLILMASDQVSKREILNKIIALQIFPNAIFLKNIMIMVLENKGYIDFIFYHDLIREYFAMNIESDGHFLDFLSEAISLGKACPEHSNETKILIEIKEELTKNKKRNLNSESSNKEHDEKLDASNFKNNVLEIISVAIQESNFEFIDRLLSTFIHSERERSQKKMYVFNVFLEHFHGLQGSELSNDQKKEIWSIIKKNFEKLLDDNVVFELGFWQKMLSLFSEHPDNLKFSKRMIDFLLKKKNNDDEIIQIISKLKSEEKIEILNDIINLKKKPNANLACQMMRIAAKDKKHDDYATCYKLSCIGISIRKNKENDAILLKLLKKTISLKEAYENPVQIKELYQAFLKSGRSDGVIEEKFKEFLSLDDRPISIEPQEAKEETNSNESSHLICSKNPDDDEWAKKKEKFQKLMQENKIGFLHTHEIISMAIEKKDLNFIGFIIDDFIFNLVETGTTKEKNELIFKTFEDILKGLQTNLNISNWQFIKKNINKFICLPDNLYDAPQSFFRKLCQIAVLHEDIDFFKDVFEYTLSKFENKKDFIFSLNNYWPILEKTDAQTQKYFSKKIINFKPFSNENLLKKLMVNIINNKEYNDFVDHYNLIREYFSMNLECDSFFLDFLNKTILIGETINEYRDETKNLIEITERITKNKLNKPTPTEHNSAHNERPSQPILKKYDLNEIIDEAINEGDFYFLDEVLFALVDSKGEQMPPKLETFSIISRHLFLKKGALNNEKKINTWAIIKKHFEKLMQSNICFEHAFCSNIFLIAHHNEDVFFLKDLTAFLFRQVPIMEKIQYYIEHILPKLSKEEKRELLEKTLKFEIMPAGILLKQAIKIALDSEYDNFDTCHQLSILGIRDTQLDCKVVLKILKKSINLAKLSNHVDAIKEIHQEFLKSGISDDELNKIFKIKIQELDHMRSFENNPSVDHKEEEKKSNPIRKQQFKPLYEAARRKRNPHTQNNNSNNKKYSPNHS